MIREALSAYPTLKHRPDPTGLGSRLVGSLVLEDASGATNRVEIEVTVPTKFPGQGVHPLARIVTHDFGVQLTEDAHVGFDGSMCVQMPERNEINYQQVGLLGFLEQVELHLRRARIWALTDHYPGPEYPHFDAGRREYQKELPQLLKPFEALKSGLPPSIAYLVDPRHRLPAANSPCPCHSGVSFKACHREEVKHRRKNWRALGRPPERLKKTGAMVRKLNRFLESRRGRR